MTFSARLRQCCLWTTRTWFAQTSFSRHRITDRLQVQMIGVAVQQAPWLVVIEFMPYGDLKGVLEVGPLFAACAAC